MSVTISTTPNTLVSAYRPMVFKLTSDLDDAASYPLTEILTPAILDHSTFLLGTNIFQVGDIAETTLTATGATDKHEVTAVYSADSAPITVTGAALIGSITEFTIGAHSLVIDQPVRLSGFVTNTAYNNDFSIIFATATTIWLFVTFGSDETGTCTPKGGIVTTRAVQGSPSRANNFAGTLRRANDNFKIKNSVYKFTDDIVSIASVANNGDGTVKVTTSTSHGYSDLDVVALENTTTYDKVYEISLDSSVAFDVTATWVATSTGDAIKGTLLAEKSNTLANGFYNFNVNGFLQDELDYHLLDASVTIMTQDPDKSMVRYGCLFTEQYDSTASLQTDYGKSGDFMRRAVQATQQHTQTITFANYRASSSSSKFLTNAPLNQTIRVGEMAQLSIQSPLGASTSMRVRYEQYDLNGASLGINNQGLISIYDQCTIPIRSAIVGTNISKVDVWLANSGGTQLSEKRTYTHGSGCLPNAKRIWWLNLLGGFDSYTFTGYSKETINTNVKTFKKNLAYDYQIPDRGETVISNDSVISFTAHSGLVPSTQRSWLSEIFSSPELYVEEGGVLVPIILKTQQQQIFDEGDHLQFRINYIYASSRISQRG